MGFGRGQGPAQAANPHNNEGRVWTQDSHLRPYLGLRAPRRFVASDIATERALVAIATAGLSLAEVLAQRGQLGVGVGEHLLGTSRAIAPLGRCRPGEPDRLSRR